MLLNNLNLKKTVNKLKTSGFALLYAILLAGAITSVGVILMNIITKQIIFSSLGRSSDIAYYYLASSGRECLVANFNKPNKFKGFNLSTGKMFFKDIVEVSCFSDIPVTFTKIPSMSGLYKYSGSFDIESYKVDITLYANENCLKDYNDCGGEDIYHKNTAVIESIGYSSSEANNPRRLTRKAVTIIR